ncbi:MAG: hypothetical protein VYE59_03400 [Candidatus Thermoplasmatota archaeon]|nr:hypothetical protein [Candidatus Thermoplasmatota archaeon]MEE3134247.1 hypothetical protein [Candidatus Thermoplasmatota archaeon]CAI8248011.1 MAG: Uncharacterised protein [Euryarchaeota archaeon]
MKRIWLSRNRGDEEGGWIDLTAFQTPGMMRILDTISISAAVLLILSGIWVYQGTLDFLDSLEKMDEASEEMPASVPNMIDGRWPWEAKLLLDTCTPLNGTWDMPETLADQDDIFWYPGELECIWPHQGVGDRAVIAIRNAATSNQDFIVNLSTNNDGNAIEEIGFGSTGNSLTIEANESGLISLVLNAEPQEEHVYAKIESSIDPNASIILKIAIVSDSQSGVHIEEGQNLDVHYRVFIYDTGELLDEGDLPVRAGEDDNYIKGFGWGQVGLDCNDILSCRISGGTTHTVLLPPDLAYKNRDDRPEANNQWLQFELTLNRLYV